LAEVRSQEGESIETLLRRFKRKVQTEDIIKRSKKAFLLPETRPEEAREASSGTKTCAEKDSYILGRTEIVGLHCFTVR
jgi:small subunit ribosomal protein S21